MNIHTLSRALFGGAALALLATAATAGTPKPAYSIELGIPKECTGYNTLCGTHEVCFGPSAAQSCTTRYYYWPFRSDGTPPPV